MSTSGFNSEAGLSTPPYTPHRTKRRFERNESPVSVTSIEPAETSSPAKKAAERYINDEVKVEELAEGDAGYFTDIDVIHPDELEEVESDSDDWPGSVEDIDSDGGIATRLSRLECEDGPEAEFERKRREKRLRKRMDARVFKRSHSQSVQNDTDTTDPDAMADHDLPGSARRLRRRVYGPSEVRMDSHDILRNSETNGLAPAAEIRERRHDEYGHGSGEEDQATMYTMDVDDDS